MKIFKTLSLLLILFSVFSSKVFSAEGCLGTANNPDRVYTSEKSTDNVRGYGREYNDNIYLEVCGSAKRTGTGAIVTGYISPDRDTYNCFVLRGNTYYQGYRVNYNVVECPIDDYIPAVVMAMAGAGFFLIRRRDLAI